MSKDQTNIDWLTSLKEVSESLEAASNLNVEAYKGIKALAGRLNNYDRLIKVLRPMLKRHCCTPTFTREGCACSILFRISGCSKICTEFYKECYEQGIITRKDGDE